MTRRAGHLKLVPPPESSIPQSESSNRDDRRNQLKFEQAILLLDQYESGLLGTSTRTLYQRLRELWGQETFDRTREHYFNMKSRAKDEHYATPLDRDLATFPQFIRAIGPRPNATWTVDRIDNSRGYSAVNIRWADKETQAKNRSSTLSFKIGDQTGTLDEWSQRTGLPRRTIRARRAAGLTDEEAIFGPNSRPHVGASRRKREAAPCEWSFAELKNELLASKYARQSLRLEKQRIAINELLRRIRVIYAQAELLSPNPEEGQSPEQNASLRALEAKLLGLRSLLFATYPKATSYCSAVTGYIEDVS